MELTLKAQGLWLARAILLHPTTPEFKKRLLTYPGVIVSSIILRPNGDLIPATLRENGVKLPPFTWTVNDFRDLNGYLTNKIMTTK